MKSKREKKDRFLIIVIISVSLAGLLYFGYMAISENSSKDQGNPYEYNIEEYRDSGSELNQYIETLTIPVELESLYGLAVGPDDQIYISGDKKVLVLNPDGSFDSEINLKAPAGCITVDVNGDIYLGETDRIEVYDRNGRLKADWGIFPGDAILTSIALSEEFVFIADAGNLVVWKCDKSGSRLLRIGDRDDDRDIPGFVIPSPYFDVVVDSDGFLWAANTGRHSLENYTLQGDFRTSWGESSMEVEGFAGCCNPSHFLILEDGRFVTSEKGIARVKVYNRLGEFVFLVAGPDRFKEGTVGLDLAKDSAERLFVLDPTQKSIRIFVEDE